MSIFLSFINVFVSIFNKNISKKIWTRVASQRVSALFCISIFLTVLTVGALTGCEKKSSTDTAPQSAIKANKIPTAALDPKQNLKIGFLYFGSIHDEGYTTSHDRARRALLDEGYKNILYAENVPAGMDCEIVLRDLISQGCQLIYSTTYNFLDPTLKVAKNFPDIKFAHCSGGITSDNVSTYFGRMYEARYLSGIVAAMKSKSKLLGYVAAYPLPEVIRGLNAFALGAQSIDKDIKVIVMYTNTWYDAEAEKRAAEKVLSIGCDVISQHQDTTACQIAAAEHGAFCIGYNIATPAAAPKAYLTSVVFDWTVFVSEETKRVLDGQWTPRNYWGGLSTGTVDLAPLSLLCTNGTAEKVVAAKKAIIDGTLPIFCGPLFDTKDVERVKKGVRMTDGEIWGMNYLLRGIQEVR